MDQGPLGSQHRGARPPLLFPDCGWQETARAPAPGMEFLFPSARPFSGGDPCLIGKHLCLNGWKGLGSLRPRRIEIVSELASHLEDCYEECRTQGVDKSEAIERSLEQVASWPNLSRKIQRAKRKEEIMNYRTQTLWLPGLICMALSAGWMFLLQRTLAPGQGPWQHAGLPLALYLLWLATLPVFGAIRACLSKRQGGEQLSRIAASLFLPLVMSGFWIAVTIYVEIRVD